MGGEKSELFVAGSSPATSLGCFCSSPAVSIPSSCSQAPPVQAAVKSKGHGVTLVYRDGVTCPLVMRQLRSVKEAQVSPGVSVVQARWGCRAAGGQL